MLAALARAEARATFFPLAPRVVAYPELIARIRAEGHLVGLHGWAHLKHPESTREGVEADTERALAAFGGERPRWWRLPYGMAAPWSDSIARAHGLRVVGWSHDTHDWRGDSAQEMAFSPGEDEVVLLHDALGPGVRRAGCAETVRLVESLLADGHRSVTLDEPGMDATAPAAR